jgi:hypothetical protein
MGWLPPSLRGDTYTMTEEKPSSGGAWLPPSLRKKKEEIPEVVPGPAPQKKPNLWQQMMAVKKQGEGAPMIPLPKDVKPLPGGREQPTITATSPKPTPSKSTVAPGQLVKSGKGFKIAGVPKDYYKEINGKDGSTPITEFEHGALHAILPYLDEDQLSLAFPTKRTAWDFIGEFAGSVVPFTVLGKVTGGIRILNAIKGAPLVQNVAKSAIKGALEMAAYSAAGQVTQNKSLEEKAKEVAISAGIGGVLGGGSEVVGGLMPKSKETQLAEQVAKEHFVAAGKGGKATLNAKGLVVSPLTEHSGMTTDVSKHGALDMVESAAKQSSNITVQDVQRQMTTAIKEKGITPEEIKAAIKVGNPPPLNPVAVSLAAVGKKAGKMAPIEQRLVTEPIHQIKEFPALGARIQQEADVLVGELTAGEAPQLVKGSENMGGVAFDRYTRTKSSNPDWFRELGKSKKEIFIAIEKIKQDQGADKGATVERVKELIVNRLKSGVRDRKVMPTPPDDEFIAGLTQAKSWDEFNKAFTPPKAGSNRMATSMSGAFAGIEPELDENGKPTGKMKFNPTKAAVGMGAMAMMGGLKFEGKPGEGPKYIKQPGIRSGENLGKQLPRQLIESIKDSPWANPELIAKLKTELHGIRNTNEAMQKAELIVKNFPYQAKAMISGGKIDDDGAFIAQALIKQAQDTGNLDEAVILAKDLARKATEGGRFVQAFTAINKLSPEGILRFAQSTIDEAMRARPNLKLAISPANAQKLVTMATEIGKMAEGTDKQFATQKLLKEIYQLVPPTAGQITGTLQTMAQLLNPKTIIRNVVGNTLFGGLENVNQALVAAPLDKFLSLVTGKRTTLLPSIRTQAKGFVSGMKEGFKEAVEGVPAKIGTQFELSKNPIFTGNRIRDKILGTMEKTMNVVLRAPDRAAYKAAFDDSIRAQLKISKTKELTAEMIEEAHQLGLYRTFQDENVVSIVFMKLKKGLNAGKDFGLGDFILKYPKTPGNLLARSIDYSPVGIANAIFQAGKGLKSGEFSQKAFVDSFSRGITGTAGIASAAVLARLGIITALPSKDRDVREMQRESGEGQYQVNASALYRFTMSGLNPAAAKKREGDTLVTYDWAQPVSTNIALGARLAEARNPQKAAMDIGEVLTTGTETLAEQPLVSGVRRFFGGYKPGAAVADALKSIPASFTPTLLKQGAQVIDPTGRQTRSDELFGFQEALNRVIAKVPFATKLLAPRIGVFGKESKAYQPRGEKGVIPQAGNLFNVFLNPAFIAKYKPNKEAQEVIRLMETTGETRQFPKYATPTIRMGKGSLKLTPAQGTHYQQYLGYFGQQVIGRLLSGPTYAGMSDEGKVKRISSVLTDLNKQTKARMIAEVYIEAVKGMTPEQKNNYLKGKEALGMMNDEIYQNMIEVGKRPNK